MLLEDESCFIGVITGVKKKTFEDFSITSAFDTSFFSRDSDPQQLVVSNEKRRMSFTTKQNYKKAEWMVSVQGSFTEYYVRVKKM